MPVSSEEEFSCNWLKQADSGANDRAYRTGELACIQHMIHYQRFLHVSHRFVKFLEVSLIFNLHVKKEKGYYVNRG